MPSGVDSPDDEGRAMQVPDEGHHSDVQHVEPPDVEIHGYVSDVPAEACVVVVQPDGELLVGWDASKAPKPRRSRRERSRRTRSIPPQTSQIEAMEDTIIRLEARIFRQNVVRTRKNVFMALTVADLLWFLAVLIYQLGTRQKIAAFGSSALGSSKVPITVWISPSDCSLEIIIFSVALDVVAFIGALQHKTAMLSLFVVLQGLNTIILCLQSISLLLAVRVVHMGLALWLRSALIRLQVQEAPNSNTVRQGITNEDMMFLGVSEAIQILRGFGALMVGGEPSRVRTAAEEEADRLQERRRQLRTALRRGQGLPEDAAATAAAAAAAAGDASANGARAAAGDSAADAGIGVPPAAAAGSAGAADAAWPAASSAAAASPHATASVGVQAGSSTQTSRRRQRSGDGGRGFISWADYTRRLRAGIRVPHSPASGRSSHSTATAVRTSTPHSRGTLQQASSLQAPSGMGQQQPMSLRPWPSFASGQYSGTHQLVPPPLMAPGASGTPLPPSLALAPAMLEMSPVTLHVSWAAAGGMTAMNPTFAQGPASASNEASVSVAVAATATTAAAAAAATLPASSSLPAPGTSWSSPPWSSPRTTHAPLMPGLTTPAAPQPASSAHPCTPDFPNAPRLFSAGTGVPTRTWSTGQVGHANNSSEGTTWPGGRAGQVVFRSTGSALGLDQTGVRAGAAAAPGMGTAVLAAGPTAAGVGATATAASAAATSQQQQQQQGARAHSRLQQYSALLSTLRELQVSQGRHRGATNRQLPGTPGQQATVQQGASQQAAQDQQRQVRVGAVGALTADSATTGQAGPPKQQQPQPGVGAISAKAGPSNQQQEGGAISVKAGPPAAAPAPHVMLASVLRQPVQTSDPAATDPASGHPHQQQQQQVVDSGTLRGRTDVNVSQEGSARGRRSAGEANEGAGCRHELEEGHTTLVEVTQLADALLQQLLQEGYHEQEQPPQQQQQ